MNSIPGGRWGRTVPAFCFVLAAGIAAAAGPVGVAEVRITPGEITWSPNVTSEKWLLTVSGQGAYLRELVRDGEPLRLRIAAPDSERLADGAYNWELRAVMPSSTTAKSVGKHSQPTRSRSNTLFERGLSERPIVTSGSFRVTNSEFVMPSLQDRGRDGHRELF